MLKLARILSLLFICSTYFSNILLAQKNISGTITDSKTNLPLIGVTIVYQEGQKIISGTNTDRTGTYSITAGENGSLIFSYVGYKPNTVVVKNISSGQFDLKMDEDISNLNEVVVTGLATSMKRSNLANAITTLSAKQLTGVTAPQTLDESLEGKIPGANIIANSGAPGGGINVRLRGITTIFGSSQPLYVVDGVYMDNSTNSPGIDDVTEAGDDGQDNASNRIADLNPDDIATLEVLKGASAAAIYGSRAASGVIIITTKRGKAGVTAINFSQDLGISTASKLLGVRKWDSADVVNFYPPDQLPFIFPLWKQAEENNQFFDYEKDVYGNTALQSESRVSVSGGSENTQFYLSGSFKDDDGIALNTGYQNASVRANLDHDFSQKIKLSYSSEFISSSTDRGLTNNDNTGITYGISIAATPSFINLNPVDGIYPANPLAASNVLQTAALITNNENVLRTLQSLNLKATLWDDNSSYLNFITTGGFDAYTEKTTAIFPPTLQFESNGQGTGGASIQGFTKNVNTNLAAYFVFYHTINNTVDFTTSAGVNYNTSIQNQIINTASELVTNQSNVNQAGALSADQLQQDTRETGFFGQEEINYNDLLIGTVGVTFDRNTNDGDINKFYPYPKFSFAWNINKMPFFTDKNIDNLKFRIAFGQAGNFPEYGVKYTEFVPANNEGAGSEIFGVRGNPDIEPETSNEFETGFDIDVYNGRLSGSATWYQKNVSNMILQDQLPFSTGFNYEWINSGSLQNRGVELSVTGVIIDKDNFNWTSTVSFWKNKSLVTSLGVPPFEPPGSGFGDEYGEFYIQPGKSATQIIGYTNSGKDSVWGDAEPKFSMSFDNEFTFLKNFTLTVFAFWKYKFSDINFTQSFFDEFGTSPDYAEENLQPGMPNGLLRFNSYTPQYFVLDASYLRIREIGLYYTLPLKPTEFVKGFKVGFSADNYFTFTKYISYDPDVSNFGTQGVATGVELVPYPSAKTVFVHLDVTF